PAVRYAVEAAPPSPSPIHPPSSHITTPSPSSPQRMRRVHPPASPTPPKPVCAKKTATAATRSSFTDCRRRPCPRCPQASPCRRPQAPAHGLGPTLTAACPGFFASSSIARRFSGGHPLAAARLLLAQTISGHRGA